MKLTLDPKAEATCSACKLGSNASIGLKRCDRCLQYYCAQCMEWHFSCKALPERARVKLLRAQGLL